MSKIYTHFGDRGSTSLVGGKTVSKTHIRIEAYGTLDELSSHIGVLVTMLTDHRDKSFLYEIQQEIFSISACLATEPESAYQPESPTQSLVEKIEGEIDFIHALLPPLRAFILPGGARAAAYAHVCRTVCRRAERRIVSMSEICEVDEVILRYVNRLSDYFFVLARKINKQEGIEEILKK